MAAAAGMSCCLMLGLQPAAGSQGHGDRLATTPAHMSLKTNLSVEPMSEPYLRLAQASDLAFIADDVVGEPNAPIPLQIQLASNAGDDYRFFKIKGLPDDFELSSGFPTKEAWLVAVKNIDGLTLIPPDGFVGDVAVQILLFKGKDDPPQARTVTISIRAREPSADPAVTSSVESTIAPSNAQAQSEQPRLSTVAKRSLSKEDEDAGMTRARGLLEKADIAAARLIYESMVHKGSGRAAFAMGQTYDPAFLGNFVVEGLQPDIEQATKWYQLAAELGSSEAEARLVALNVER